MRKIAFMVILCIVVTANVAAKEDAITRASSLYVKLPAPQLKGGKPLMQVLERRKSSRDFSEKEKNREQEEYINNLLGRIDYI